MAAPDWMECYGGSRALLGAAALVGMPLDQVNFLAAQLFCVLAGWLLRTRAPATLAAATLRYWLTLGLGLGVTFFCTGKQTLMAVGLSCVSYLLLRVLPSSRVHHITLAVCVGMLSCSHLYRKVFQAGVYVIDITGPMMVMVQRATSLACAIHDMDAPNRSEGQKRLATKQIPGPLPYFAYMFSFQCVLAGPFLMFRDFQDFIQGTDAYHKAVAEGQELRPTRVALRKLGLAALFGVSTVALASRYPVALLVEPSFSSYGWARKLWLLVLTTTLARHLYYTAWLAAEAAANISGLGWRDGGWGGADNVDIWAVEFGTSLRTTLDAWNSSTVTWLRYVAYERLPKSLKVYGVYALSAVWHGFYPGYYFTFLSGAVMTEAARTFRRTVRPRVLALASSSPLALPAYHVLTWAVTRLQLAYGVSSFVLLHFHTSLQLQGDLYYFIYVASLAVLFLMPLVLQPPRPKAE